MFGDLLDMRRRIQRSIIEGVPLPDFTRLLFVGLPHLRPVLAEPFILVGFPNGRAHK